MERRTIGTTGVTLTRTKRNNPSAIHGVASVYYDGSSKTEFELWQGCRERIMAGAFDRAIAENQDVLARFDHETLLGRTSSGTLKIESKPDGLHYKIKAGRTNAHKDLIENIERGDVTGSSFAFRVVKEAWRSEDGNDIREIHDVDLFDVGPVVSPAYSEGTNGKVSVRSAECVEARDSWNAWQDTLKDQHERKQIMSRVEELLAEIEG